MGFLQNESRLEKRYGFLRLFRGFQDYPGLTHLTPHDLNQGLCALMSFKIRIERLNRKK